MPLGLDFLNQIVNVQWGGKQFLYSGGDGMFRSSDGASWIQMSTSVPAISLAWIDDVWIGVGKNGEVWRSEDGAQTWTSTTSPSSFVAQVAAMRPVGEDDEGKPLPGKFALLAHENDDGMQHVYISNNLGKSWSVALSIIVTINPDAEGRSGHKVLSALSGCAEAFFIGGTIHETFWDAGSGYLWVSTDGISFDDGTMVFGPGTNYGPDGSGPTSGFSAAGVGYDTKTRKYMLCGTNTQTTTPNPDGSSSTYNDMIYTISVSPHFGLSTGTPFKHDTFSSPDGGIITSGAPSVAGGEDSFATTINSFKFSHGPEAAGTDLMACWVPGSISTLTSVAAGQGSMAGSMCFKSAVNAGNGNGSKQGIFACVAFGAANGVYVAKTDDDFTLKHNGQPIRFASGTIAGGAIAVGKISFQSDTA